MEQKKHKKPWSPVIFKKMEYGVQDVLTESIEGVGFNDTGAKDNEITDFESGWNIG